MIQVTTCRRTSSIHADHIQGGAWLKNGNGPMRSLGKYAIWSMKADRELIELAKTETLEAIADEFKLPPKSILQKAKKLGLSIKRKGKMRK
jgi:hypothetical protein